jgi:hydrogenase/urease accessory protein HupE
MRQKRLKLDFPKRMIACLKVRIVKLSWFAVCVLSVLFASAPSVAHEIRPTIADLELNQSGASIRFKINLEAIIAEIGPDHDDTDNSPSADFYNELRAKDSAELEKILASYASTFQDNVVITGDNGETIATRVKEVVIPAVGDVQIARDSTVLLQLLLTDDVKTLNFSWASDYGDLILRAGSESSNDAFNQYLLPGVTSDSISLTGKKTHGLIATVKNYFVVGFVHIVPKGLDHILFVIGLFLLSPYWRAIFLQVSAFTVAHTITLAMGMTGYLQVSADIVEPLIALSIAVVCLENVFTAKLQHWRLLVVTVFGLLHGLGFAGVLSEIGFSDSMFLASLLSFNIGVEVGQLVVIFACFLIVGWPFRKKSWYRRKLTIPASIVLSGIGLLWFFQRVVA